MIGLPAFPTDGLADCMVKYNAAPRVILMVRLEANRHVHALVEGWMENERLQ